MLVTQFNPFPQLETNHLILRRVLNSDVDMIFRLRSDPDLMKYIDRPRTLTVEDAHDLIRKYDETIDKNEGVNWGMALKENNKLIGTIAFWRMDKPNYRAEIGYMLLKEYQGKGLMQEAMQEAISFGFNVIGLHSIEANVNPQNEASKRILEKMGFVMEAYFKENYYYNGRFLDSCIYSLIYPGTLRTK
jgi:[ribosomal protein S5]-alanine N-acetyltransferase